VANAALAFAADGLASALVFRFVTGLALAGVYPVGMKLVVSWAPERAGNVLGWLVGMLTFGSGVPHLVRGLALTPHWQGVIYAASALAVVAAIMVGWLGDGPHHGTARRLHWGGVLQTFRLPRFRAAAFGYFGHMWELYAVVTLAPLLVAPYLASATPQAIYLAAAGAFAAGGIGCILGGIISHHVGSARVAIVALAGSATCCLVFPLVQGLPAPLLLALVWAWGLFAVTDSPQFSALAAGALPPERMGSALAFMNSVGFGITIVGIELATAKWESLGPQIGWLLLPGPLLGLFFMMPLWRDGGKSTQSRSGRT
jgi:MFS family permease